MSFSFKEVKAQQRAAKNELEGYKSKEVSSLPGEVIDNIILPKETPTMITFIYTAESRVSLDDCICGLMEKGTEVTCTHDHYDCLCADFGAENFKEKEC